jgi:WhiB family redox-sensing transcriptional regulator
MTATLTHPTPTLPACAGITDDTMHPDPGDAIAITNAKGICNRCTIADRCLNDALELGAPEGVWGGYTGDEIRWMKAGAQPRPCDDCGTSIVPRTAHQRRCGVCSTVVNTAVRKRATKPVRQPCGTLAALLQHQAAGEPIDDACTAAHWREIGQRNVRQRRSRASRKTQRATSHPPTAA